MFSGGGGGGGGTLILPVLPLPLLITTTLLVHPGEREGETIHHSLLQYQWISDTTQSHFLDEE